MSEHAAHQLAHQLNTQHNTDRYVALKGDGTNYANRKLPSYGGLYGAWYVRRT